MMKLKNLMIKVFGAFCFLSLLVITGVVEVKAATPVELDLEIVTAPNYISSPCPMTSQNQTNNPGGNSGIDHAAHHRTGKDSSVSPIQLNNETRSQMIQQLIESGNQAADLIKTLEFN